MSLTRRRNDGNFARKPVTQLQGIQIRIPEFKLNPNSELLEIRYTLKVRDIFFLPRGSLKCCAIHTFLINKIYLAQEAVREYTVLYCAGPSRTFQLQP